MFWTSRVNLAKERTRFTPLRDSGNPVSAGWDHVKEGHFDRPLSNSRSIFDKTPEEIGEILQSKQVVSATAKPTKTPGLFVRTVDVGEVIGRTALKHGGEETTKIRVFTDRAGNLVTAYPIP